MPDTAHTIAPISVAPKVAATMLGYGLTFIYELLKRGELESYTDGASRRIMTSSIHSYVQRRLEANAKPSPRRGGPGRKPRKT